MFPQYKTAKNIPQSDAITRSRNLLVAKTDDKSPQFLGMSLANVDIRQGSTHCQPLILTQTDVERKNQLLLFWIQNRCDFTLKSVPGPGVSSVEVDPSGKQ